MDAAEEAAEEAVPEDSLLVHTLKGKVHGTTLTASTGKLVDAWLGIPFMVVTLMAGLQRIPDDYVEAARIDGARPVQIFRRITLPLLRPVLMTCVLLSTVWTFNSFQVIWPLTKGGPAGATATLPIQIYETAFGSFDFGTSSAMAVVVFAILMTVSLLYWRVLKGGEE